MNSNSRRRTPGFSNPTFRKAKSSSTPAFPTTPRRRSGPAWACFSISSRIRAMTGNSKATRNAPSRHAAGTGAGDAAPGTSPAGAEKGRTGEAAADGRPEAVAGLDLSKPGLLEASAGTGKTYAIEHLVLR